MQNLHKTLRLICHAVIVVTFACAATLGLQAQRAMPLAQSLFFVPPATSATLPATNEVPEDIDYSSSAGAEETASAENYMSSSLAANPSPQPLPRRYGRRPVYADSHHNADGSNKYTFFGGGGVTIPVGGSHNYLNTGYNFQVGGGRNFNKKFALLAQFDFDHFGLQTGTLNNLLETYSTLCGINCTGSTITQVGGTNHIWSFTLDPQYTYMDGDRFGGYLSGGVGFYHKVTDITTPVAETFFDPYYGYITEDANATFDSYVSNSVGFNGGLGFTYKASRFSDLKFYAEARYVYTDNQARKYYDGVDGTNPTSNPNYLDVFPQNSAKTTYIPVTFGIRF